MRILVMKALVIRDAQKSQRGSRFLMKFNPWLQLDLKPPSSMSLWKGIPRTYVGMNLVGVDGEDRWGSCSRNLCSLTGV